MKEIISIIVGIGMTIGGWFGLQSEIKPKPFFGLAVLTAPQGGTGIGSATVGDVGKVLTVSDDSPFTYTLQTVRQHRTQ